MLGRERAIKEGTMKKSEVITWNQYFMGMAKLSACRSKDPVTKVGACIVNEKNHVLALGYNGMPVGCDDEKMPWGKVADSILDTKYPYVCHAELNAILNSGGRVLENSRLYVTMFPCCECAKAIIQVGIKKVIYYQSYKKVQGEKSTTIAAKKMFEMAGVGFEQFIGKNLKIEIEV